MKRMQKTVVCMAFLFLTACAFSPANNVTDPPGEMAGTTAITLEAQTGIMQVAAEQTAEQDTKVAAEKIEEDIKREDAQARTLYELFINEEYAGAEGYAYGLYDADGDGSAELYIDRGGVNSFYIVTYENGGLCIRYQAELPLKLKGCNGSVRKHWPRPRTGR